MTNEETQKTMEFILSTQAKSEAHLDRVERVLKLLLRVGRRERSDLREKLNALIDAQTQSDDRFQEFLESSEEKFNALIDAQTKSDDRLQEFMGSTEEKFTVLVSAQTKSDDRLHSFLKNTEEKFTVLVSAQTKSDDRFQGFMGSTEEKFAALVSAQLRTDEALAQMAQAITRTSQRVEAIEENGTKK